MFQGWKYFSKAHIYWSLRVDQFLWTNKHNNQLELQNNIDYLRYIVFMNMLKDISKEGKRELYLGLIFIYVK